MKLGDGGEGARCRTVLVVELVEVDDEKESKVETGRGGLTRTQSTTGSSALTRGTSSSTIELVQARIPNPPSSLIKHDPTNPLLPTLTSIPETFYADLGSPLILPFRIETLVERLFALQKLGKQVFTNSGKNIPEVGTRSWCALRIWNLTLKYPGPLTTSGNGSGNGMDSDSRRLPPKKESLAVLGRKHSENHHHHHAASTSAPRTRTEEGCESGEEDDDGPIVQGRYSKTAAIRKATSKVLGRMQSGRTSHVDDEREEWITPFAVD